MKDFIHARLDKEEKSLLDELKQATGETASALVKKGLRLIYQMKINYCFVKNIYILLLLVSQSK